MHKLTITSLIFLLLGLGVAGVAAFNYISKKPQKGTVSPSPPVTTVTSVTSTTATDTAFDTEKEKEAIRNKPFPLAGMDEGTPVPEKKSGISGTVSLGPTCPVMHNPPDPACEDKPYTAEFVATLQGSLHTTKDFSSDSNGKFSVTLPPGNYLITKKSSQNMLPRCTSTGSITVIANIFTDISLSCDTGIR
jgi:hypothetical protein